MSHMKGLKRFEHYKEYSDTIIGPLMHTSIFSGGFTHLPTHISAYVHLYQYIFSYTHASGFLYTHIKTSTYAYSILTHAHTHPFNTYKKTYSLLVVVVVCD